jgi:ABC-type branched-subunit amino acid transport system substrate-binding protein
VPPFLARSRRVSATVAIASAGALTLALAACGNSDSSTTAAGYKVGFVLQLSGTGSVYAETTQAGQKAALADVNAANTAGVQLTSETADAGSDAQSATTACTRLIQQDKVQAIIAFVPGPQLLACNTIAARSKVPLLSLSSGAGSICAANLTSYGLVPNQQTLPAIDDLLSQGKKKWYFFGADYSTPKATIALAKPYLTGHGGQAVGESYEPIGTSDYSQDITAIVKAHPDVAFLNVIGNDDVALQKQWAADPRTKGIVRVDILMSEGSAKALGAAADGIWSSNAYFSSIAGAGNDTFKAAAQKAGLTAAPDVNSYVSYLQVEALAHAVKTGGTDGQKVIAALKTTSFAGPVGAFQVKDAFSFQPVYLAQAGSDGSFTIKKKSDPIAPQLSCHS